MTKIQTLIGELNTLNLDELELMLKEVLRRLDQKKRAEAALDKLIGAGKGVWEEDAQQYTNELREGDRL